MRKWLAWMLVLALCLGGAAMAEDMTFTFRNGVTWESTLEEVRQSESAIGTVREYNGWIELLYGQTAVSKFTAELIYAFREDRLYCCLYYFDQLSAEDRDYLTKALSSKYGEPFESDPEALRTLLCLMDPVEEELLDVQNWRLADGTYLATFCLGGDDGLYLTYFDEEALLEWSGSFNTDGL